MTINLDDAGIYNQLDPQRMRERIAELPLQCRDAWANVQRLELPRAYADIDHILILGMGGSAMGGDLTRALTQKECRVPITVVREYAAPMFVGARTLAIASSHSGNTEETIAAFQDAHTRGAKLLAITGGGKIAELAQQWHAPLIKINYASRPRAALGHSFVPLVGVLHKLNLIADPSRAVEEAIRVMEDWQREIREDVPSARNPAKQLAQKIFGRTPIIYGGGFLSEVAHRWKTQFNENAKSFAFFEIMPELNHNAVVGYEFPATARDQFIVLMLISSFDPPRIRARFEVTRELLAKNKIPCEVIAPRGESALAHLLASIHFGDYVSYYLALLNNADPTPNVNIDLLKRRLAEL